MSPFPNARRILCDTRANDLHKRLASRPRSHQLREKAHQPDKTKRSGRGAFELVIKPSACLLAGCVSIGRKRLPSTRLALCSRCIARTRLISMPPVRLLAFGGCMVNNPLLAMMRERRVDPWQRKLGFTRTPYVFSSLGVRQLLDVFDGEAPIPARLWPYCSWACLTPRLRKNASS